MSFQGGVSGGSTSRGRYKSIMRRTNAITAEETLALLQTFARRSRCGRAPSRSQSDPSVQLRREQAQRRSIERQQHSHHPAPSNHSRRAVSFDNHRPLSHHLVAHVAMDVLSCYCLGNGCDRCGPPYDPTWNYNVNGGGPSCSFAPDTQAHMSNENSTTPPVYSNQEQTPGYGKVPLNQQPPTRGYTYPPPTTRPTRYYNLDHNNSFTVPSNTIPMPYHPQMYLDAGLPAVYRNQLNMGAPQHPVPIPQSARRSSFDTVPIPPHPQSYFDAEFLSDSHHPPNVGVALASHPGPQPQLTRCTPSNTVPMPDHSQAYLDPALPTGYRNMQSTMGSSSFHSIPQPQAEWRTFTIIAPKPDRQPQDYGSNGQFDTAVLSPPSDVPWQCKPCKKPFANAGNLNRHIGHHCGVRKQYPCGVCGANLSRLDLVKKHVKDLHKEFACKKCKNILIGEHAHTKHRREVHGDTGDDSSEP